MCRMKVASLLVVFCWSSLSCLAASEPSDGWRGAKWGLTVDEVLKVFKGEAKTIEEKWRSKGGDETANVELANCDVYGKRIKAQFWFTNKGGL